MSPIQESDAELEDGFRFLVVPDSLGGQNTSRAARSIDSGESPKTNGVVSNKGLLEIDTGYFKLGQTVRGDPRLSFDFKRQSGASENILVTDLTVYKHSSTNTAWEYLKGSAGTTLDANEASGQTIISVTATAGFATSDFVGITLNDGTQHQSTIASIVAGVSITIDDALPSAADSGNAFIKALVLTGSAAAGQVDGCQVPSNDWFVFTNNADAPQRYDGTDIIDVPNLPSGGNFQARTCAVFGNYLMFGNTTEGGTNRRQRIRWPDTGDPTNWSTGNSGFVDLFDFQHPIVSIRLLGPYAVIYRTESVTRCELIDDTSSSATIFNFDTVVNGDGALSVHSVSVLQDRHIVVGNTNIYEYRAGFELTPVGLEIYNDLFSHEGDLDVGRKDEVLSIYIEELNDVFVFFPSSSSSKIDMYARIDIETGSWFFRTLTDELSGVGKNTKQSSITWNDLVGPWTDQTYAWNSQTLLSGAPVLHLLSPTLNEVFEYDYSTPQDDGTAITYSHETKDFESSDRQIRTDRFEFKMRGTSIKVEYSLDEGATWITLKTFMPGAAMKRVKTWKQLVTRTIRFRFSGSGGGFALDWFGFKYRDESITDYIEP